MFIFQFLSKLWQSKSLYLFFKVFDGELLAEIDLKTTVVSANFPTNAVNHLYFALKHQHFCVFFHRSVATVEKFQVNF